MTGNKISRDIFDDFTVEEVVDATEQQQPPRQLDLESVSWEKIVNELYKNTMSGVINSNKDFIKLKKSYNEETMQWEYVR